MKAAEPSRTALATAYARAHHQIADRPRIFTDPLAASLLGTVDHAIAASIDRPRRLFFATRSRYAEDRVAVAVAAGVRQVVLLGAGLDTFGYRNQDPLLRVFEVDHPATQAWKRERLAAASIDQPTTLTMVPVDFESHSLATELEYAGFERSVPAIFVWLGVVYYLTPAAAQTTLEYVAGQANRVEVVLDYLQPASNDQDRAKLRARADRLAAAGEPLLNYFTPDDIDARLRALGFTDIDDRAATDVIDGYLERSFVVDEGSPNPLPASRLLRARR